jgi:hypothetical protein
LRFRELKGADAKSASGNSSPTAPSATKGN